VKDVGSFPTAYAQSGVQQVEIFGYKLVGGGSFNCAPFAYAKLVIEDN
jgi:hypothetical protein